MNLTPQSTVAWGGAGMVGSLPNSSDDLVLGNSFKDLMSEDLAKDLQQREERALFRHNSELKTNTSLLEDEATVDTSSDLVLALYLQREFDKEYDSQINREEKHYNKNSKLSVSLSKYKVHPESYDSDLEDYDLDDDNRELSSFKEKSRTDPLISTRGYSYHNKKLVTKHDKTIAGHRNAEKVMKFPPGINTGGFDTEISNQVYNHLARSAMSETKRKQRVNDKVDKATAEKVMDPKTRLLVFKMVNNSILESVNGIVSTGKESVVFHATGGIFQEQALPEECAIKVFKTTLTDFKTRERYIKNDHHFKDRMSKNSSKMMIKLWAEKEFHNLRRLQKAGLRSPTPLLIKQHVIVMSFIGSGQSAAPKLKHIRLSREQWIDAYEQVVDMMVTLFGVCKLVHGDMSEYNILWFDGKCWVIDLGQAMAVEPLHPNALQFLHRDCGNIIGFFQSKGLTDLPKPLELFEKITKIEIAGKEDDAQRLIEEYEMSKELWKNLGEGSDDQFEHLWKGIKRDERKKLEEGQGEEDLEEDEDIPPDTQSSEGSVSELEIKKKRQRGKKKNKESASLTHALRKNEEKDPESSLVV